MGDSIKETSTFNNFDFEPNWNTLPKTGIVNTRFLFGFEYTADRIQEMNPESPITFEASFDFMDKNSEYRFLDFIHTQIGRNKKFWVKYPKSSFVLYDKAWNTDLLIKVVKNNFEYVSRGVERIYIEMKNGDLLVRQVVSAALSGDNTHLALTLKSALDRDIEQSPKNYFRIGRYLLVRFDDDSFRLKYSNDGFSSISLKFVELVKEYPE